MKVLRHKTIVPRFAFGAWVFFLFFPVLLFSEDKRDVPLDLYLIVDGSSKSTDGMDGAIDWINRELVDGILQEGDSLTVWIAAGTARIVYSGAIGAQKDAVKAVFQGLTSARAADVAADFAGALREAASQSKQAAGNRMSLTLVVSGSASALAPALRGGSGSLFRWSRVYASARWQVLAVDTALGDKIRQAATAYMNSR